MLVTAEDLYAVDVWRWAVGGRRQALGVRRQALGHIFGPVQPAIGKTLTCQRRGIIIIMIINQNIFVNAEYIHAVGVRRQASGLGLGHIFGRVQPAIGKTLSQLTTVPLFSRSTRMLATLAFGTNKHDFNKYDSQ